MFGAGLQKDERLPLLRDELQIQSVGVNRDGMPTWVIYDPVRHSYFKISKRFVALMEGWKAGTINKLRSHLEKAEGFAPTVSEIRSLSDFLIQNELARIPAKGAGAALLLRRDSRSAFSAKRTVQSATFFRVPLFHPAALLNTASLFVRPLFSGASFLFAMLLGLLGLWMLSQQWGLFLNHGNRLLLSGNPFLLPITLAIVMTLHELGHAFQATLRGVRVSSVGFALMVFAPLLYTDVSDAWRLPNRRDRLFISLGGVLVDLWLAMIAVFIWAVAPDGFVRDASFLVATTSLFLSIFVNLNPLLRFDGYYVLSDLLGQDNLHPRAAKRAIEWVRRAFFGLQPDRTRVIDNDRGFMAAFGVAAYFYRLLIMVVIVALIYVLFGPVFGVIAAIAMISVSIVMPMITEAVYLLRNIRRILSNPRGLITVAVMLGGFAFLATPLPRTLSAPAIMLAANQQSLFPPRQGQIVNVLVQDGDHVRTGQILAQMSSVQIDAELKASQLRIDLLELRLKRIAAHDQDRTLRTVLISQLEAENARKIGTERIRDQLTLRAPSTGLFVDASPELKPGAWIDRATFLGRVIAEDKSQVYAMAPEIYAPYILTTGPVRFYPSDVTSTPSQLGGVDLSKELVQEIRPPRSAIIATGDIVTAPLKHGVHKVQDEWRWVTSDVADGNILLNPQVGHLVLKTKPLSRLQIFSEQIAAKIRILAVSR